MKKKIILYNVIFILLFLICILLVRYYTPTSFIDFDKFVVEYANNPKYFRSPEGLQYKDKKPIVLYGCSFTYGEKLEVPDTFSYQLSRYIKRPVYNFASPGHGIQHMYYYLTQDSHYEKFSEPEYVIYTFIPDHIYRLHNTNHFGCTAYLQYKYENGHFVRIYSPFRFFHPTLLYNNMQYFLYDKFIDPHHEKYYNLLKLYLEESKKALNKHYPNTKFVVLLYDYCQIPYDNIWNDLRNQGFIIYKVSELANIDVVDPKYKLPKAYDKWEHPNRAAWEVIIPKLTEALNLQHE